VGRLVWGWELLLLILVVVLVHEAGHFAGMKLFGYADVDMFFIPLFGGAVSGRGADVPGYQRALVALMGPVPGLALGTGCLVAYWSTGLRPLWRLAQGFLLINAFNLLPFYPLDGGHLLGEVLFCRSRHAELLVRLASGALLALAGWLSGYWVLVALGVLAMLFSGGGFRTAGLVRRLRYSLPAGGLGAGRGIPPEAAATIIAEVRAAHPYLEEPADIAGKVEEVWEKLRVRPPGLLATVLILLFYCGLLLFVGLLLAAFCLQGSTGGAR
jgi:Zn-dependent protease